MKTICTDVYTFDELSNAAKEKARDWYRRASADDSFYCDEIYDSLKSLFKAANIKLTDWQLGARTYNSLSFDLGDAQDLQGKRAIAWLENNLLNGLRITRHTYMKNRKDYLSYGDSYRIGKIAPCPFTGICYDDDFLDALQKAVRQGDTLKDAFKSLADVCQHLAEAEEDYRNSDEAVDESITCNSYTFTIDGKREG